MYGGFMDQKQCLIGWLPSQSSKRRNKSPTLLVVIDVLLMISGNLISQLDSLPNNHFNNFAPR
jgi:hypothetical protein